jgi:hypothetical protein
MRTHDQPPVVRPPPVLGSSAGAASASDDEAPELFMGECSVFFDALERRVSIFSLFCMVILDTVFLLLRQICFLDNIFTLDVMEEPVIATDGFTYEKRSVCLFALEFQFHHAILQVYFGMVQNQENQPHHRSRSSQASFHRSRCSSSSLILTDVRAVQHKFDPQPLSQEPN